LLIENAIDDQEFCRRAAPAAAKARLGIPPQRLLIGAVGRLSAEKGFDLLIHSVDRLLGLGLDVGLILVGEGEQRAELQALVTKLGRSDRIQLLGFRSDTRDLYE